MERKEREMNAARRSHRESANRHRARDHKKGSQREPETNDTHESAGRLLAFTIVAGTGEIVKCEGLDANGDRYELSENEKSALAKEARLSLEEVLSRAFEAGMSCALDDAEGEDPENGAEEPEEDAELRRLLLTRLIERSAARHLFRRDVLSRVIFETLIEHSRSSRSKTVGGTPGSGLQ
jgi:hypothetical protein